MADKTVDAVSKLVAWALTALSLVAGAGAGAGAGATLDETIRRKIVEAARSAIGWKGGEIRVDEVEQLRRPGCSFYTVANNSRMDSNLANFALVGDKVIGGGDGMIVAKLLDTCSHDAPADWWAEIVTRYHRDLGSGLVLRDERVKPGLPRKLSEAGQIFMRPAMDKDKRGLTFLLWEPELNIVYRIHATRSPGRPVHVEKVQVLPAAA